MEQKLEENKGIPASLLWMLAIISGLSVANLYYNQPLLNRISEDLGILGIYCQSDTYDHTDWVCAGIVVYYPFGGFVQAEEYHCY